MRRPNKPTKRKQRRNAFGQFASAKPRRWIATHSFPPLTSGVEWERSPEAGWRAKPANALQADLERGQTLPEPMQALVQQPIERTLWQRLCSFLRGRT